MEIDIPRLALFGEMFFAKGFEIEFAGVLNDGFFLIIDLNGKHMLLHLILFGSVEIERAQRPERSLTRRTAFGIRPRAVMHNAPLGVELLRSNEFVNRPLNIAFEPGVQCHMFKLPESRGRPDFQLDIFQTRKLLMPHDRPGGEAC